MVFRFKGLVVIRENWFLKVDLRVNGRWLGIRRFIFLFDFELGFCILMSVIIVLGFVFFGRVLSFEVIVMWGVLLFIFRRFIRRL